MRRFVPLALVLAGCTSAPAPAPAPQPPATASAPKPAAPLAMRSDQEPATKAEAAPPAAPEPVYDLDADRTKRALAAKNELGAKISTTVVSDIFVVVGPTGWQGPSFDQSVGLMKGAMAGYLNNRFAAKPARAITVYLFPNGATYEAFCKKQYGAACIAHYGFYSPNDRYMVMNAGLGLGTLTHEMVHPLVEADFPKAPTWINEGLASLFEGPVIPKPGEIHGVKNWRHPRLARALRSAQEKDHARLDTLFGMSDTTFRNDDEDLHYAMARFVCQWLDQKGKLWDFYHQWRDHAADDPNGTKAFEKVMGESVSAAHEEWAKWVLSI